MKFTSILIIALVAVVGISAVAFLTGKTRTVSDHGVTFAYPKAARWQLLPSTDNNYQNYYFTSLQPSARNPSTLTVSVPIAATQGRNDLAQELPSTVPPAAIRPASLAGHRGEYVRYQAVPVEGDVPWTGEHIKEHYQSAISNSPLSIHYARGSDDPSLDELYATVKSSLRF